MEDHLLEEDLDPDSELEMESFGYVHVDKLPDYDRLRDQIQGIIEAMYQTGEVMRLESCLDEICRELGINIHPGDPILEKKTEREMQWYLGYQQAQIDRMNGR